MDNTIFLAKLFGFVLVLMALNVFFCKKHFRAYADHLLQNPGAANLLSLFAIIVGVMLLLTHNIWAAGWGVVVTILCWIVMLRGLFGFFCPDSAAKVARKTIDSKGGLYVVAVINGLVGLFLLIMAYSS